MWQEIQDALLPGQKPEDTPHIAARLFHLKLRTLLDALLKHNMLGKVVAHMNIDICSTVYAFKYLYKYVYKGSDRATVALGQDNRRNHPAPPENDEIMNYVDVQYVGPCEAAWRLSQFEMQGRSPAICHLQV